MPTSAFAFIRLAPAMLMLCVAGCSSPTASAPATDVPIPATPRLAPESPLSVLAATERGDLAALLRAIGGRGEINQRDAQGRTAAMIATHARRADLVEVLLKAGADINLRDNQQDNVLLYAGAEGLVDIVNLAIEAKADTRITNRFGGIALIPAAERGHVEVVEALLTRTDSSVDHVNDLGWTALLEAVILGTGGERHQRIVQLLITHGADINVADKDGVTALQHAQRRNQGEVLRLLQTTGARASTRADCSTAEASKRRTPLALYYDLKLAVRDRRVFEWRGSDTPRAVVTDVVHVAVSSGHGNAIDTRNRALRWPAGGTPEVILESVAYLAAGDSGLLAIRCDGSLWKRKGEAVAWTRISAAATHAWVGDGADYYIAPGGRVFASGRAARGQYGNGRLKDADGWVPVAEGATRIHAHTGHALLLYKNGDVLGTGGNIFGPLGKLGFGDKSDRWGVIFRGATHIGTGSTHSMAIKPDGSLWLWGAVYGVEPIRALGSVRVATGGTTDTLAMLRDGTLMQWRLGETPQVVRLP